MWDSSVLIPVINKPKAYTELVFYPIYSPSDYNISLEFYDSEGVLVHAARNFLNSVMVEKFFKLNINRIIEIIIPKESQSDISGVKIINDWSDKNKIPTRLKYGLNVGLFDSQLDLPTNICFAPQIANTRLLNKPGTFKWAPFLNKQNSIIYLSNNSPGKIYERKANILVNIFRERDAEKISREILVPANGHRVLNLNNDYEIKNFLGDEIGWVTFQADNPYVNGWYFDFNSSGLVAGDHLF